MKNKLELLEEEMMNGHLREVFEQMFPKDQEAIDGIRPSKSNRSGALVYQGEIIRRSRELNISFVNNKKMKETELKQLIFEEQKKVYRAMINAQLSIPTSEDIMLLTKLKEDETK